MAADWVMKAHDRLPSIQATLGYKGGSNVDLTTATTVTFIMRTATGTAVKVNTAGVIVDKIQGIVRYDWAAIDTDTPGDYQAEWQITWNDGRKQTFPTETYHTVSVLADLDGV